MQLSEILAPGAVKVLPKASSKKRLFCDLAEIVQDLHGVDYNSAFSALQETRRSVRRVWAAVSPCPTHGWRGSIRSTAFSCGWKLRSISTQRIVSRSI